MKKTQVASAVHNIAHSGVIQDALRRIALPLAACLGVLACEAGEPADATGTPAAPTANIEETSSALTMTSLGKVVQRYYNGATVDPGPWTKSYWLKKNDTVRFVAYTPRALPDKPTPKAYWTADELARQDYVDPVVAVVQFNDPYFQQHNGTPPATGTQSFKIIKLNGFATSAGTTSISFTVPSDGWYMAVVFPFNETAWGSVYLEGYNNSTTPTWSQKVFFSGYAYAIGTGQQYVAAGCSGQSQYDTDSKTWSFNSNMHDYGGFGFYNDNGRYTTASIIGSTTPPVFYSGPLSFIYASNRTVDGVYTPCDVFAYLP